MTNTRLLNAEIIKSGIGRVGLAEAIGISLTSLQKKINNEVEFRQSEIQKACVALNITDKESIFFAQDVDLK